MERQAVPVEAPEFTRESMAVARWAGCVRARLQSCRKRPKINAALAAGGPKTKTPRTSRGVLFYENDCLRIGMDRQAINVTR
jgi:hypothetical protein